MAINTTELKPTLREHEGGGESETLPKYVESEFKVSVKEEF